MITVTFVPLTRTEAFHWLFIRIFSGGLVTHAIETGLSILTIAKASAELMLLRAWTEIGKIPRDNRSQLLNMQFTNDEEHKCSVALPILKGFRVRFALRVESLKSSEVLLRYRAIQV